MKLKHFDHDGRARFVTFCTHRKIPLLFDDQVRATVLDAVLQVRSSHDFKLVAYVIMPEHVHLVILPNENESLGKLVGEVKRLSARAIHSLLSERRSPLLSRLMTIRNGVLRFVVWQRRCYDRNCRSESEMWRTVQYCHENPVRRGLVNDPAHWKWSSYAWYLD